MHSSRVIYSVQWNFIQHADEPPYTPPNQPASYYGSTLDMLSALHGEPEHTGHQTKAYHPVLPGLFAWEGTNYSMSVKTLHISSNQLPIHRVFQKGHLPMHQVRNRLLQYIYKNGTMISNFNWGVNPNPYKIKNICYHQLRHPSNNVCRYRKASAHISIMRQSHAQP